MYISVDLEGKDKRLIFNLRGPQGYLGEDKSKINSILNEMHIWGFNVTREYLYLTGADSNYGQTLLSRIPIAGAAEQSLWVMVILFCINWNKFQIRFMLYYFPAWLRALITM